MKPPDDGAWDEAQRRCHLSDAEVRMAKELGFQPKSLIKNIPAPSQKWKAPVSEWVRMLHEKKIGPLQQAGGVPATPEMRSKVKASGVAATPEMRSKVKAGDAAATPQMRSEVKAGDAAAPPEMRSKVKTGGVPATLQMRSKVIEFRNPEYPWPDKPEIPERVLEDPFDSEEDPFASEEEGDAGWGLGYGYDTSRERYEPPTQVDIDEQNTLMLRSQCRFRWAAQTVAIAMSQLPEVQKVAAFGAVAQPLIMEVPRFREFRRHRIEVLHECSDLDLAVWMAGLSRLKVLKSALSRGLSLVQDTPYGGVAHHQVDVHLFDAGSGDYRGRLCIFGQCPKPGKRECLAPNCGAQPFLQQFQQYRFNPARFEGEPRVILFDRAKGFLVRPPKMDAKPTRIVHRARKDEMRPGLRAEGDFDAGSDEDVPF